MIGDFLFTLKSWSDRTVRFDFSDPLGCSHLRQQVQEELHAGHVQHVAARLTYGRRGRARSHPAQRLQEPTAGQTAPARFYINFADPSGRELNWTVRFDPRQATGSTYLSVTRTGAKEWVIEATDDMVASLSNYTTGSGKQVTTQEGNYRMPFRIE